MITKEKVLEIIDSQIIDDGYFVVEVKVKTGNRIQVYIDGNQGITIEYIKQISRLIEGSFDREIEDFELEVSSPGIGQPFKVFQQYIKRLGKTVQVTLSNGSTLQGLLEHANEEGFSIKTETKEKREGETKKSLHVDVHQFKFQEVKSVIDIITF